MYIPNIWANGSEPMKCIHCKNQKPLYIMVSADVREDAVSKGARKGARQSWDKWWTGWDPGAGCITLWAQLVS